MPSDSGHGSSFTVNEHNRRLRHMNTTQNLRAEALPERFPHSPRTLALMQCNYISMGAGKAEIAFAVMFLLGHFNEEIDKHKSALRAFAEDGADHPLRAMIEHQAKLDTQMTEHMRNLVTVVAELSGLKPTDVKPLCDAWVADINEHVSRGGAPLMLPPAGGTH